MEKWDEEVRENLHGSAYLKTWDKLPYHLKCVIAESMYEVFVKLELNQAVDLNKVLNLKNKNHGIKKQI